MLLSRRLPSCRRTLVHAARHASTKGTPPPSAAAQSTIGAQSSPASQASASPRKPLTAPPPIVKRPTPSDQPLPGLRRALGVRERPTVEKQSRKERLEQIMLNPEGVQKERQHLLRQAGKSYYEDMINTRHHGGKTWIAPKQAIREDKALFFPNITGKSLLGNQRHTTTLCFGRITVLSLLSTRISEIHSARLVQPTLSAYAQHPLFQHVQINLQENLLKSFLVSLFTNSIKKQVPEAEHDHYLVSSQNMEYLRGPIGMDNEKVGYVYLIDENLKIRWAAGGEPEESEIDALRTCTGVLLRRWEREPKSAEYRDKAKEAVEGTAEEKSGSA
ncbi:ATP10 protein-domain-containing protein [Schizophyllum commune]